MLRQTACTVAQLTKRLWLVDETCRAAIALLSPVFRRATAGAGYTQAERHFAVRLMAELVEEFASGAAARTIGLSWDAHVRIRRSFQSSMLLQMLRWLQNELTAGRAADGRHCARPADTAQLLALAECIFDWNFAATVQRRGARRANGDVVSAPLCPPIEWRAALFDADAMQLFCTVYAQCGDDVGSRVSVLRVLARLASLSGPVVEGAADREQHAASVLRGILGVLCIQPISAMEHLARAQLLCAAFAASHRPSLVATLGTLADVRSLIDALYKATGDLLNSMATERTQDRPGGTEDELGPSVFMDAVTGMLCAWDTLLGGGSLSATPVGHLSAAVDDLLRASAANVFASYCAARQRRAEYCVLAEESREIAELDEPDHVVFAEQLTLAAAVGRRALAHCIGMLHSAVAQHGAQLQAWRAAASDAVRRGMSVPAASPVFHEQLYWLLLILGHFVADTAAGEKPQIPAPFLLLDGPDTEPEQSHVVVLIEAALALCAAETDCALDGLVAMQSSSVAAAVCWFLRRWVCTYLLHDEGDYEQPSAALLAAYGANSGRCEHIVDWLLRKVELNSRVWSAQPDVADATADLLLALCQVRGASSIILRSAVWPSLVRIAHRADNGLPPGAYRALVQALCVACSGYGMDAETVRQHLCAVLYTPIGRLSAVMGLPVSELQQAANLEQAIRMLQALCGAVMAVNIRNYTVLFPLIFGQSEAMIRSMGAFSSMPDVAVSVLELFVTACESMMVYLSPADVQTLISLSLSVLETHGQLQVSIQSLSDLDEGAEAHRSALVHALRLLSAFLTKDFADFSASAADVGAARTIDRVVRGLGLVVPYMTVESLRFPDVCAHYFQLLGLVCDLHAHQLIAMELPEGLLPALVRSLQLGLSELGDAAVRASLAIVTSLAQARAQQRLQPHGSAASATLSLVDSVLQQFLASIIEMVLAGDLPGDDVHDAMVALYSLFAAEREGFLRAMDDALGRIPAPEMRAALVGDLNAILASSAADKALFTCQLGRFFANARLTL